jgi:hypothetical protein
MLTVAIATEYDGYDGAIYHALLERLRGSPVAPWRTEMRFNGDRSVRSLTAGVPSGCVSLGVTPKGLRTWSRGFQPTAVHRASQPPRGPAVSEFVVTYEV